MDENDIFRMDDGGDNKKKEMPFEKKYLIGVTVVSVILVILMTIVGIFIGYSSAVRERPVIVEKNPVVNIQGSTSLGVDVQDITKEVEDSVVQITSASSNSVSRGSGVVYGTSQDKKYSHIITNAHVVDNALNAANIKIRLANGNEYTGIDFKKDRETDIAIITIEATGLKQAMVGNSNELKKGEHIIVIGNPLGTLGGSVTDGIISALDRDIVVDNRPMKLLQTNAEINPGNSGGGMFNMQGQLIGIVNAKSTANDVEGIGFAIPIDIASKVADDLIVHGHVTGRIDTGINVIEITNIAELYHYFGILDGDIPALYVLSSDPSLNVDIRKGDIIVAVDSNAVSDIIDYNNVIKKHKINDVVKFTIKRGGYLYDLNIRLREYQE